MSATVVAFDQIKRKDQTDKGRRVQEAMNAFRRLMEEHGCDFVYLGGRTPDGHHFTVHSGDQGGVDVMYPDRNGGAA